MYIFELSTTNQNFWEKITDKSLKVRKYIDGFGV